MVFIPFYLFALVGASNAQFNRWFRWSSNSPCYVVAACFAFISYVSGNIIFSDYLQIVYIEGVGEASAILWINNWSLFRFPMV